MKRSELKQIIREEMLSESLERKMVTLEGKTINDTDYDPYSGYFILHFTDGTSAYLGVSGFDRARGDELYIEYE